MRLANVDGRASLITDGKVLDVEQASGGVLGPDPMVLSSLEHHDALRVLIETGDPEGLPPLEEASLGPPVPRPTKIVAIALNYRSHAEDFEIPIPDEPHLFAKFPSCVTGPQGDIVIPAGREMVDFEAEVVLVLGKRCHGLGPEVVWDHIAGVTGGQDISDREEQFRPPVKQFTMAKSYDTFGPTGPVMVTPDEFDDPNDIELVGRLDGTEMQRGRTSDLIFPVPELVSWLNRFMTFEPGDLIFTGTPSGTGEGRQPPVFLREGMVLETEISGVGTMRNVCARPEP
ncbi:MAG: fumarylacetoacetate hydrolase family protein [Acidimicrobiia bacterium]